MRFNEGSFFYCLHLNSTARDRMVSTNLETKNKSESLSDNSTSYKLEEFIKDIGTDAQNYSQEEIEVLYNTSVKLFNRLFDKWGKEKSSSTK